jgi:hypothetical protein
MGWVMLWVALCIVVAVAAQHRGRSPVAWGLVAMIFSPLIAGLLVLVMNRVEVPATSAGSPADHAGVQITTAASAMFDGAINGRPYRKTADGMIEVNTGAGMKRFASLEQATDAVLKG